jgi:hypothetical protein
MEQVLDSSHGTTVLLAGMVIILCLHLVMKIVEMGLKAFQKKSDLTDRLHTDFRELNVRLAAIERDMNDVLRFRHDFSQIMAVLKSVAGPEKWEEVSKEMAQDALILRR